MAAKKSLTVQLLIYLLLAVFMAACTAPRSVVRTEQYHEAEPGKEAAKILNGLQLKALQLMNQQKFDDAISYLQRAIKVEPRNALNWHYLAQNYWHKKDYKNCRSMVQRAMSYSQFDEDLSRANNTLMMQCTP